MAHAAVAAVKLYSVGDIKMAHKLGEIGPGGLDDHMEMVPHQDVGVQNHLINVQGGSELFQKQLAVAIVSVNRPPVVSPAGDVIVGVGY